MNENMESFKCGSEVKIDFCHGPYNRKQTTDANGKWKRYNECEEVAFQAFANEQKASGIPEKNLPNSIILYVGESPTLTCNGPVEYFALADCVSDKNNPGIV